MSHGSIFRFATTASSISASDFHHAALDADASARLAAIDRSLADDEHAAAAAHTEAEQVEAASTESQNIESANLESQNIEISSDADNSAPEPQPQSLTESEPDSNSETEAQAQLQIQAQTEDELLATLIAESEAARNNSHPVAQASAENELDANDPLAILSQTIEAASSAEPSEAAPEVELAQVDELTQSTAAAEELPAEVTGIFAAAEAAGEIILHPPTAPELPAEVINLIETAVEQTEFAADSEPSAPAPAPLEVAPILDASGELQPGADDYTPPVPFEIHVPDALTVTEAPAEILQEEVAAEAEPDARANTNDNELSETFDLDSLCAPTEAEQIIDKAIAQEEAVAEMNAAAEEFVAGQIASDSGVTANETAAPAASPLETAAAALNAEPASDRRRKRRALISAPIRVRSINVTTSGPDEIATTVDVSRYGILFYTVLDTYQRGMDVAVVFPYHKSATGVQAEQFGRVVRLHDMPGGRQAVAIALGVGIGEHLVDSCGRKLGNEPVQLSNSTAPQVKKPLVLMADSDSMLRDSMKMFLQNEGYEVIAVSNANDAREVLNMFTPALIVAEIEGESDLLPGLDLCAHVKSSPSLRRIPVVLTSRSAYPSDYSNAHSLGAVVCMAKPYKQERLGHIVRLLAPLPEHLQSTATQRTPDPTRGFRSDCNVSQRNGNGSSRNGGAKKSNTNGNGNAATKNRFKFPSFR
jgi:CheY-like chemotaxis protein